MPQNGKPVHDDSFEKLLVLEKWLEDGKITRAQYDTMVAKITGAASSTSQPQDTAQQPQSSPTAKKKKSRVKSGCLTVLAVIFGLSVMVYWLDESGIMLSEAELAERTEQRAKETAKREEAERTKKAEELAKKADDKKNGFHCLSQWDGSHRELVKLVEQALRDPDSFEHVETRVTPEAEGKHTIIMTYRAKNGFGGINVETINGTYANDGCSILSIADQ